MELNAVDLMAFMLFSQLAIAAYLLYSFVDQERAARRRTEATLAQIERWFAELEKRMAGGTFRSAEELDRVIARSEPAAPASANRKPARPRAAAGRPRAANPPPRH